MSGREGMGIAVSSRAAEWERNLHPIELPPSPDTPRSFAHPAAAPPRGRGLARRLRLRQQRVEQSPCLDLQRRHRVR